MTLPTFRLSSTDKKTKEDTWPVVCLDGGKPIPGLTKYFPTRQKARTFARKYNSVPSKWARNLFALMSCWNPKKSQLAKYPFRYPLQRRKSK